MYRKYGSVRYASSYDYCDSVSDDGNDRTIFCENGKLILDITRFTLRSATGYRSIFMWGSVSITVDFGTHHMFGVLETGMLAETGKNMWIQVSSSSEILP